MTNPDTPDRQGRITSYAEFFDYYLMEHRSPRTRALHYAGTMIGFMFLLVAVVTFNPWFLLAAVVAGYGFAWVGHAVFERNRPATFRYPLWSFISDFRMLWLWLGDRLEGALDDAAARQQQERQENRIDAGT